MSFFAVLIALLIEQLKPLPRDNWVHHRLVVWVGWAGRNFDAGKPRHVWVVWCVSVLTPTLLVALAYLGIGHYSLVLGLHHYTRADLERARAAGERLQIHMESHAEDGRDFDATLSLQREPLTAGALARCLLRYPAITLKVVFAIHWQALLIWCKRNPVYDHPSKQRGATP